MVIGRLVLPMKPQKRLLEEMQTGMVVSMVVCDLVQETLKVRGF